LHIILLTHEREVNRISNTGQLALNAYPQYCQRIIWGRTTPNEALVTALNSRDSALLFPKQASEESCDPAVFNVVNDSEINSAQVMTKTLVLLDATWQEARKMWRQSPYLQTARTYSLASEQHSKFTLRRNQVEGGLCTVECIITLFEQANMKQEAAVLATQFTQFLDQVSKQPN